MDDLSLGNDALRKNLDELEIINYWLGGNEVVINALNKIQLSQNQLYTLADLGSGGGDTLRNIAKWARQKKLKVQLTGIDANQFMIDYAKNKAQKFPEIHFSKMDIFSSDFKAQKFDIVVCSLFCHHFTDEELIELFKILQSQVSIAFIINDLHRHWFAYYSIKWLTWLLRGSYLVQNDAPLSVLRAFKKSELIALLKKAGIHNFKIRWKWAFRYQIIVKCN
jgi:ubiquinone/menaquinone biosynthesis C-methylase UbiE